jgi:uncharacterized protein
MAHGDIAHIDIPADDMARATEFYAGVFGWEIAEMPGFDGYPMWRAPNQVSGGGFVLRDEAAQTPLSYVEVDSIDDTLTTIEAHGGRTLMAKSPIDESSWWAVFADTEGNRFGLYEGAGTEA